MSSGLGGISCVRAETDLTFGQLLERDGVLLAKLLKWLVKL